MKQVRDIMVDDELALASSIELTTQGSVVLKDRIPKRDAAVVERVRDAGAVMLGKTNVSARCPTRGWLS